MVRWVPSLQSDDGPTIPRHLRDLFDHVLSATRSSVEDTEYRQQFVQPNLLVLFGWILETIQSSKYSGYNRRRWKF